MPRSTFWCGTAAMAILLAIGSTVARAQRLELKHAALAYPNPAFPYFHFRVELDLPDSRYLEVQASVDGQKIRYLSLKDASSPLNLSRTMVHYRPPFADTYTNNSTQFRKPYIVGWLAWNAGRTYRIDVTARLKTALKSSEADVLLTASTTLSDPTGARTFDPAWKNIKSLVLTETAGVDRRGEPVDVVLAFYADEARTLKDDLRIVALNPDHNELREVPSQAYDIVQDVVEADPRDPQASRFARSTFEVPIWVPTTTARIAFQADVPARSSRIYLVYHNNPSARPPNYASALSLKGPAPGLTFEKETGKVRGAPIEIENEQIKVALHPHSGVLNELTLKQRPQAMLYHKMETNGSIHWAPEAYPPPRPWTHTSDWMQPDFQAWQGPVVVTTRCRAPLPIIPEVDAAISYKFYSNLPYIITTTSTRVNAPLAVQAMRNGEVVFKRELITHLAWLDPLEHKVQTVELAKLADLEEILMEENTPWMSFFNPATGIAFGGIQIESSTSGLEHAPRIVNPHFYCIVGPIVYWSRAMNFTFGSSASQLMIQVPKGTQLWEKWAYVLYEPQPGDNPHAALIEWHKKLTNPLRVRLTEEVEPRVPTIGTEIYIDPSKTGWEGRETSK
ncbi:MAG: hypothetical protein Q7S40_09930 [Opitutaceae bacterium]|nr:hypothetical protein [Opitutaceae bacterium]